MNTLKCIFTTAVIAALLLPSTAWAAPQINMTLTAEKEMTIEENGQQVTRRVPATEIAPGEVLIYTINYENSGDETATNVMINNPIPEGSVYRPDEISDNMDFSIDGGKTYKKPALLTYEVTLADGTSEARIASPENYTHVRWRISEIPPGEPGTVSFKVEIK